jgi:4-amino-4-deoxy-L-arabinose transferase-like glycosyltransferase
MKKIFDYLLNLKEKYLLFLFLGISFSLRLYAVLMAKGIANDSAGYGFMARDFMKCNLNKALSQPFHPFYPFLISIFSFDSANVEIIGRFISLFFGTLTLIPAYYLIKEISDEKVARISLLFYSFHPYIVNYSGMLLSEATYWGFFTFSVYLFWNGLKRKKVFPLINSGIFLALSYLTRPEGVGYLLIFLIWIFFDSGLKENFIKKVKLILALLLPLILLTTPYLLYIHSEMGQWLISKKALDVQQNFLTLIGAKGDYQTDELIGNVKEKKTYNILDLILNFIKNLPFVIYNYLKAYHFSLWFFLFLGLIKFKQKRGRGAFFLISIILFHILSLSIFTRSTIRFSIPVIPISLMWAGMGAIEFQRLIMKLIRANSEKWAFFLILLTIVSQLPEGLRPERRHREDQKKIGYWLKQNTPEGSIIMSNSSREIFYADREFIPLPSQNITSIQGSSYKEILNFAKKNNVRYILINKHTFEINRDFVEHINKSDMREIYKYIEKDGDIVTIYEIIY